MSNEIKLSPCPFCGGELEYSFLLGVSECKCCGVMIGFPKLTRHEDKIAAINTRKPMNSIVELLEKESDFFSGKPMGSLQKAYYCKGVNYAINMVRQVMMNEEG